MPKHLKISTFRVQQKLSMNDKEMQKKTIQRQRKEDTSSQEGNYYTRDYTPKNNVWNLWSLHTKQHMNAKIKFE